MAGIYTIDATNVDEFCAALCGARSLEEWKHWGEIAKQTVVPPLDARCERKFPRSEINNLPNTATPTRPAAQLPGKSSIKQAESDNEIWVGVGNRKREREENEWTAFHREYYSFRGWTPCDCERAKLASPPDIAMIAKHDEVKGAWIVTREESQAFHQEVCMQNGGRQNRAAVTGLEKEKERGELLL